MPTTAGLRALLRARNGGRSAIALVLVGGLSCLVVGVFLVLRDSDDQIPFDDLRVGSCLRELDPGTQARGVRLAPCDEPHAAEVLATFAIEGEDEGADDYPGDAAVRRLADEGCDERVAEREAPVDLDRYVLVTVAPTEDSWGSGDRVVHCLLATPDGSPSTGSLLEGEDG